MRIIPALSVILVFIAVLAMISWGLFSQTIFGGGISVTSFGWYVYAFASGIFLLGSPAVFPFTLTVIPMATKRRLGNAVVLSFAFSIGVLLMLVAVGFFSGLFGLIGFDMFSLTVPVTLRVGMLVLGVIAYVLALPEVDLMHIVRGRVGDKVTAMLSGEHRTFSAFILGVFLSIVNIHPATLLLLGAVMLSGDPLHGAGLLLMHAIGRIIPLLIALTIAALGIDVSEWISERKERMRILLGWVIIGVAGLLIDGALTGWTEWLRLGSPMQQFFHDRFALAILWLVPLWVLYFMESRRIYGSPLLELKVYERAIDRMEYERRALIHTLHFRESANELYIAKIERQMDVLLKKRRIIESGLRHSTEESLRGKVTERLEERLLVMRFAFTVAASLLVVTVLSLFSI
ncbi:MAG TPA: hypothetical protein VJ579_04395 [Candidatus Paceibacterota bacterium]|nr:hypothetical protein [Candidatus Paceibacterota bacterium]